MIYEFELHFLERGRTQRRPRKGLEWTQEGRAMLACSPGPGRAQGLRQAGM